MAKEEAELTDQERAERDLEKERRQAGWVDFTVTKPMVVGNKFKGPGSRLMDPEVAKEIFKAKCGHYGSRKDQPELPEQRPDNEPFETTPRADLAGAAAAMLDAGKNVKTALPEDFPHKKQLEDAGYVSLEQLKEPGVEEKLKEIEGIGPAALKKIGLALDGK